MKKANHIVSNGNSTPANKSIDGVKITLPPYVTIKGLPPIKLMLERFN